VKTLRRKKEVKTKFRAPDEFFEIEKRSAHDASRLSPKRAVDVKACEIDPHWWSHAHPLWEGTHCAYGCGTTLSGKKLK
jgi:hypothetical protein